MSAALSTWAVEENARFDAALSDPDRAAAIEKRLHDEWPKLFTPAIRAAGFKWWLERAYEENCKREAPSYCPRCALRSAVAAQSQ